MKNLRAQFNFLNKRVDLETNSPKIFDLLKRQYSYFASRKKRSRSLKIGIDYDVGTLMDGHIINFSLRVQSLLRDRYIMFHAAALASEKTKKATIFLGQPGSGKSTISAIACQNGYRLLSDEICVVNKKHLTLAPFPVGLMKIHSSTYKFLKENGLKVYTDTKTTMRGKTVFKELLEPRDLAEMGIDIADKEYPIDKIYILRKNGAPFLDAPRNFCYCYRFRDPSELMADSRFLFYILQKYRCKSIMPARLDTYKDRRKNFKRVMTLLNHTNNKKAG